MIKYAVIFSLYLREASPLYYIAKIFNGFIRASI